MVGRGAANATRPAPLSSEKIFVHVFLYGLLRLSACVCVNVPIQVHIFTYARPRYLLACRHGAHMQMCICTSAPCVFRYLLPCARIQKRRASPQMSWAPQEIPKFQLSVSRARRRWAGSTASHSSACKGRRQWGPMRWFWRVGLPGWTCGSPQKECSEPSHKL